MTDFPFYEVAREAEALARAGHTVFQKFTCDGCGSRQTMAEPNRFYLRGQCEVCGAETDIKARGCNYLLMANLAAAH